MQRRYTVEAAKFKFAQKKQEEDRNRPIKLDNGVPWRLGGSGALAWRQSFGVRAQFKVLAFSLLLPMLLSWLPVLTDKQGLPLALNMAGALAFYTALLLPSCIRYDFRRDIDRLGILKALPLSATRVCAGQLATPIIVVTAFQAMTLGLFQFISPYDPLIMLAILLAFIPFNFFLFSYENLLFLWYPYRLHSEGIQTLLRTILAFTAKSIALFLILGVTFAWLILSRLIVTQLMADPGLYVSRIVFAIGMLVISAVGAGLVFGLLARAFAKFDPSCDLAGIK